MLNIREELRTLQPYSNEEGEWAIKLDANECAFNLPAIVAERLAGRLTALPFNRYPDITPYSLRKKIADDLGFTADNVSIGNGSSELLEIACYVFGGSGRSIIFPYPSFSMYPIYCKLADSKPCPVELEADYSLTPNKVLTAARQEQASLIIICNPNNPTGTLMPQAAVEEIAAGANCPVIVDEAYSEFSGKSALNLLNKYPNLIIMRTFSKAYGMASARVGYAVASKEITAEFGKAILPYNTNMLSLVAAETVYELKREFTANIAKIVAERGRLAQALSELPGVVVFPSVTNFLLFKTDRSGELTANLAAKSISIRNFSKAPGLEGCLRVTVGTPAENDSFLAVVRQCLTK